MARKVRANYKAAFEILVKSIRSESLIWCVGAESGLDSELAFRHDGMYKECEYLLEVAQRVEAACKGWINENGRVSLHLIDKKTGRCEYDLDCSADEVPVRMWCEDMHTVSGNGYYVDSQEDHIHQVRINGTFGVPLTGVWLSDSFYWVNDRGCEVEGPEVWEARYTDTAFALC